MAFRNEILCNVCGEIKWVMQPSGKLLLTCDDCRAATEVKLSLEERVERLEKENKKLINTLIDNCHYSWSSKQSYLTPRGLERLMNSMEKQNE